MTHDALEQVKLRNNFYRDSYRKVASALLLSILINLVLAGVIYYQVAHRQKPQYFATTESGRIIKMMPLNQPNLSNQALLQWSTNAVTSIFNFNFTNFRQRFNQNQTSFTTDGWRSFIAAMKKNNLINTVQNKKLIVSAVLTASPIITTQYELSGRYVWKVDMPISISFQGLEGAFTENWKITLTIQRVSTLNNIAGIGINEFIASNA